MDAYHDDVLIVAGDISDNLERLECLKARSYWAKTEILLCRCTFELLLERFDKVAFVPGNHDLWV